MQTSPPIAIVPFASLAGDPAAIAAIDRVFFTSSNTQTFTGEAARSVFRERWLGRYLNHWPQCCFVATSQGGTPLGYICGSLQDPARDPIFADQPHFASFAHLTQRYPAQLHVNLDATARGQGIGSRLIDAFLTHAKANRAPGAHAITTRGARNIGFYAANGFPEAGSAMIGVNELVFLARNLR